MHFPGLRDVRVSLQVPNPYQVYGGDFVLRQTEDENSGTGWFYKYIVK